MEVWTRKSFRCFSSTSTPGLQGLHIRCSAIFFPPTERAFNVFFSGKGCWVQSFCHLRPQDTFHAKNYPPPIQLSCFPRVPCCKSLLLQSNLPISASFCIFPIYQIVEHGSGWHDIPIHFKAAKGSVPKRDIMGHLLSYQLWHLELSRHWLIAKYTQLILVMFKTLDPIWSDMIRYHVMSYLLRPRWKLGQRPVSLDTGELVSIYPFQALWLQWVGLENVLT